MFIAEKVDETPTVSATVSRRRKREVIDETQLDRYELEYEEQCASNQYREETRKV